MKRALLTLYGVAHLLIGVPVAMMAQGHPVWIALHARPVVWIILALMLAVDSWLLLWRGVQLPDETERADWLENQAIIGVARVLKNHRTNVRDDDQRGGKKW